MQWVGSIASSASSGRRWGISFEQKKLAEQIGNRALLTRIAGNISEAYSKLGLLDSATNIVTTQFRVFFFHYFLVSVLEFISVLFSGERPADFGGGRVSVGLLDQGFFKLLRVTDTSG